MNLQQFYSQTISNQGASYSILTGELNQNNGYFVSLANNELQIPLGEFTQQTVKDLFHLWDFEWKRFSKIDLKQM